jgi:hypothetical protein
MPRKKRLSKQDEAILEIIEDAIWDGAREWDAYAMPESKETAMKALLKIKEVLGV